MDFAHKILADNLLAALESVLGPATAPIHLHEPEFAGNEWAYVKECLDTGWVSSAGKYVDDFERRLAEYTGAQHAVAVVNGTAALHVALRLAGVLPGDEVLMPALTFVATANAISLCGALPHFVDSSETTLGMDPDALAAHLDRVADPFAKGVRNRETGRRLAAIVPMHTFGHPVDMPRLIEVADRYRLPVVEDAAESLGSWLHGQHTGTFGLTGILSFNGNKVITTGGGGALLTNDSELARHAKHITTTAKRPHRWAFYHDEVAFNYRLPNLNAALGCAQLEQLTDRLARKRQLAAAYHSAFAKVTGFDFVDEPAGSLSNFWLSTLKLQQPDMTTRDALLDEAHDAGYYCRPAWTLMHRLPMYAHCPQAPLPVAEMLEASLISLPSSPSLTVGSSLP